MVLTRVLQVQFSRQLPHQREQLFLNVLEVLTQSRAISLETVLNLVGLW